MDSMSKKVEVWIGHAMQLNAPVAGRFIFDIGKSAYSE
tara:strand:- start:3816 stop:3929 length:114 start_codon:yes stop_codon:yes gene_type:complete